MRKITGPIIALLAITLFMSCEKEQVAETTISKQETILKNGNAPGSSGLVVRIPEFDDFITLYDGESGFLAFVGQGSAAAPWHPNSTYNQANGVEGCVTDEVQFFNLQYLITPNEGQRLIGRITSDDAFITIYQSDRPFATRDEDGNIIGWEEYCDLFDSEPFATGYGKATYTSNDALPFSSNGNNAESTNIKINGNVDGTDGNAYRVNGLVSYNYNKKKDELKVNAKLQVK